VLSRLREVVDEELPGVARMRAVAALRAAHPMALADCFAIATAAAQNATLITGAPEIIDRADQITCAVTDARARVNKRVHSGEQPPAIPVFHREIIGVWGLKAD
jgi:hypothetical protein